MATAWTADSEWGSGEKSTRPEVRILRRENCGEAKSGGEHTPSLRAHLLAGGPLKAGGSDRQPPVRTGNGSLVKPPLLVKHYFFLATFFLAAFLAGFFAAFFFAAIIVSLQG